MCTFRRAGWVAPAVAALAALASCTDVVVVGERGHGGDTATGGGTSASTTSASSGVGGCGVVAGNYAIMPRGSNPSECAEVMTPEQCSLLENGDGWTLGCFGQAFPCTLDAACSCRIENVVLGEGVVATIVIDFATSTIRATAFATLCQYDFELLE